VPQCEGLQATGVTSFPANSHRPKINFLLLEDSGNQPYDYIVYLKTIAVYLIESTEIPK
jgi:hypothetical protein